MNINSQDIHEISYEFPDRDNYLWSQVTRWPDISDRELAPKEERDGIEYALIPVFWSEDPKWIRTYWQVVFADGSRMVITLDGVTAKIIPAFDTSTQKPYYEKNGWTHSIKSPQESLEAIPVPTQPLPISLKDTVSTIRARIWELFLKKETR